jgi:predicted metalloprotease with PDZ domain
MPEGFKKMLQGLQKEMEKEVQDMLDPNNPGSKEQQGQPGKPRIRTFTWSNTPQRRKGPRRVRLHDTGISAERPAAALRSHLGLGLKDGGIVVGAIAPGSYAEKAGLKIHDVILKVKGETVTSVADLESLRAGGGAIDVIRKGARSSIPAPKLAGKPQKPVTPQPKAEKKAEKKELPKDF